MKLTLVECREAKKGIDDIFMSASLSSSITEKVIGARGLLERIITYLEKDVVMVFPEKNEK